MDSQRDFFFDEVRDAEMEVQNVRKWEEIMTHMKNDQEVRPGQPFSSILDIGCHTGDFLQKLHNEFGPTTELYGTEPIIAAREKTQKKVEAVICGDTNVFRTESISTIVCNEVLYLIENLDGWIRELYRILAPEGRAYVVLGSHGENDAWLRWRPLLEKRFGHKSFIHYPEDILAKGDAVGFDMELRNLWTQPKRSYAFWAPDEDGLWKFESARERARFDEERWLFMFHKKVSAPK